MRAFMMQDNPPLWAQTQNAGAVDYNYIEGGMTREYTAYAHTHKTYGIPHIYRDIRDTHTYPSRNMHAAHAEEPEQQPRMTAVATEDATPS